MERDVYIFDGIYLYWMNHYACYSPDMNLYSDINACFPHYMEFQVWLFCYIRDNLIIVSLNCSVI